MKLLRQIGLVAVVLSLSGITGCGGDTGVGGEAPGTVTPGGGAVCSSPISPCESNYQNTILDIVNYKHKTSITSTPRLSRAAVYWAEKMARCKASGAFQIGNENIATRAIEAGYDRLKLFKQVAQTTGQSPVVIVNGFDRAVNDKTIHAGFGCAKGDDGVNYWAILLVYK